MNNQDTGQERLQTMLNVVSQLNPERISELRIGWETHEVGATIPEAFPKLTILMKE